MLPLRPPGVTVTGRHGDHRTESAAMMLPVASIVAVVVPSLPL
jgi:hypothetical protein